MAAERIIAETDARHQWRAWFADRPDAVIRANWPDLAVCRLIDSQPERLIEFDALVQDESRSRDGHLEFVPADDLSRLRRIPR